MDHPMSAIDAARRRRGAASLLLLALVGCGSVADRCILQAGTYAARLTQSGPSRARTSPTAS
jgi:hypothetical protein